MAWLKTGVITSALAMSLVFAPCAKAAPPSKTKVFVMTSTYGVLAGSLTGLASLAFYGTPGDHLRNIAVGASLGLYTGVILGAYLIYFQPDPNAPKPVQKPGSDDEEEDNTEKGELKEESRFVDDVPLEYVFVPPKFSPIVSMSAQGTPLFGLQIVF